MQNNARNEILSSIRRNLAKSEPFDLAHQAHHAPHQSADALVEETSFTENAPLAAAPVLAALNPVESFRENLTAIGGNVITATNLSEAAVAVEKIIENSGASKVAFSDGDLVGQTKKFLQIEREFIEKAAAAELFGCDLGVTGAQWGIGETGTLVLESEKEFNRLTSLVPPIHVCLLETRRIMQTLSETLAILEKDLSRTVTFITGPSRTSDIELTLAIGVHGPAELYVILIEE